MKKLWRVFLCLFGNHIWTNRMEQGLPPSEWEKTSGITGFNSYTTMYCLHCGKVNRLSL